MFITRDLNYTYDDIVLRRHQTAFGDEHWGRQVFFFFFFGVLLTAVNNYISLILSLFC